MTGACARVDISETLGVSRLHWGEHLVVFLFYVIWHLIAEMRKLLKRNYE